MRMDTCIPDAAFVTERGEDAQGRIVRRGWVRWFEVSGDVEVVRHDGPRASRTTAVEDLVD
eukprot:4332197-Prorocentrum_lima.AAC.1